MRRHATEAEAMILEGLRLILRGYGKCDLRDLEPPDLALVEFYAREIDLLTGVPMGATLAAWRRRTSAA